MTTKEKYILLAIFLVSICISITVVFGIVNLFIKFVSEYL